MAQDTAILNMSARAHYEKLFVKTMEFIFSHVILTIWRQSLPKSSPYLKESTTLLHYKDQLLNAA
jgi:hypothetical protein